MTPEGGGTGFYINKDGLLITNAHVIESYNEVRVESFAGGHSISCPVVRKVDDYDVALVKCDTVSLPVRLPWKGWVQRGESVNAIGAPFGKPAILTKGVVSNHLTEEELIRSDVEIHPGNSGGPLFNSKWEAIGITTSNYAIPVMGLEGESVDVTVPGITKAIPILRALKVLNIKVHHRK
ncbi:serine protease [Mariprofundus sp. NF]|uniref:S1C family serine protease n=1 Tax=Mariprofundus sp. NF TaxID=2608716 RepID=UPI0015A0727E